MVATHPTVPSTVSDRKRLANQLNAQKSTGPKTPEGKERSSKNAISHGVFARDLLMEGEDPRALETYRAGMLRRLNPRDELELQYSEQVISTGWKIKRLHAAECDYYRERRSNLVNIYKSELAGLRSPDDPGPCPPTPASVLSNAVLGWNIFARVQTYEQRLQNMMTRALAQLRKLQQEEPGESVCEFTAQLLADRDHGIDPVQDDENEATERDAGASDGGTESWATDEAQLSTASEEEEEDEERLEGSEAAPNGDSDG